MSKIWEKNPNFEINLRTFIEKNKENSEFEKPNIFYFLKLKISKFVLENFRDLKIAVFF